MYASEYGDVVFPMGRRGVYHDCNPLKRIREEYFKNIRNILNGYREYSYSGNLREDSEVEFMRHYQTIKNGEKPYESRNASSFEWLYDKDVRKAIKTWKGKSLDVLYYLTNKRFIEKAAVREHRRRYVTK
jgi:hypothetical protein